MTETQAAKHVGTVLIISEDANASRQLTKEMQDLALSVEVCTDTSDARARVTNSKIEAAVIDFCLGNEAMDLLQQVRASASNRTAVTFALTSSSGETANALKAGSNFALERPLTVDLIHNTLNAAYGMIVRERRRYFRYRVSVPATASRDGEPAIHGKTMNVSESGLAIQVPVPLTPGAEVNLQFALPNPPLAITAGCKVRWSNEKGQCGLSFVFLPSTLGSELQAWLGRRLEEELPEGVTRRFQS